MLHFETNVHLIFPIKQPFLQRKKKEKKKSEGSTKESLMTERLLVVLEHAV